MTAYVPKPYSEYSPQQQPGPQQPAPVPPHSEPQWAEPSAPWPVSQPQQPYPGGAPPGGFQPGPPQYPPNQQPYPQQYQQPSPLPYPQQYQQPYQQPYGYPPRPFLPPRPYSALGKTMGLAITVLVLLVLTMAFPWYQFDVSGRPSTGGSESKLTTTLDFGGGEIEARSPDGKESSNFDWDEYDKDNLPPVYQVSQWMIIIGIIFSIVAIALIPVVWYGKLRVPVVLLLLGLALTFGVIALAYFAVAHPIALDKDDAMSTTPYIGSALKDKPGPWTSFLGTDSGSVGSGSSAYNYKTTWYPQAGWWLTLVAVILCAAALMVCKSRLG